MRLPTLLRGLWLATALSVATTHAAPDPSARHFTSAALANVRGIAVDSIGNLFVTEVATATVHKLTPDGEDIVLHTTGIKSPFGVAVDRHDVVYISDDHSSAVYRLAADGTPTSLIKSGDTTGLDDATTLAIDADGNLFIGDNHHHVIRRVNRDGALSTFAGNLRETGSVDGIRGDAAFAAPRGIAIDAAGNLYVADEIKCNLRRVTPNGIVTTLAGHAGKLGYRDGDGVDAEFGAPRGLAVDRNGDLLVADTNNHVIRRVTRNGHVTTFAGKGHETGAADGPAAEARFNQPRAVAVAQDGTAYVADNGNAAIRQITPSGVVTTIAGPKHP